MSHSGFDWNFSKERVQVQERFVKHYDTIDGGKSIIVRGQSRRQGSKDPCGAIPWYLWICGCVWNGMYPKLRISFFGENDDQPLDILGHPFSEKPSWVQGHAGLWWLSLLPLAAGLLKAEKTCHWSVLTDADVHKERLVEIEMKADNTELIRTLLYGTLYGTLYDTFNHRQVVNSLADQRHSSQAEKAHERMVCRCLQLSCTENCRDMYDTGTADTWNLQKIFGHGHEHRFDTHRPGWWFLVLNSLWSYIEYIPTEYIDSTQTNSLGVFGTCWNHQQASVTSHQAPADWEATEFHRTNMAKETIWVCWNWGDIQNCIFMQKIDDQAWSTMNYSWAPFVTQTHLNTSKIN